VAVWLRGCVAVVRGRFGNPGRGTSAVGSHYQNTGEGQKTRNTQCMLLGNALCGDSARLNCNRELGKINKSSKQSKPHVFFLSHATHQHLTIIKTEIISCMSVGITFNCHNYFQEGFLKIYFTAVLFNSASCRLRGIRTNAQKARKVLCPGITTRVPLEELTSSKTEL
jgi:hypothetical protein